MFILVKFNVSTHTNTCMHARIHTCTHKCTDMHKHIWVHAHILLVHTNRKIHMLTKSCAYANMCTTAHTHMHERIHMYTYAQVCKCILMHAHTAYTYVHKHVNTHILPMYTLTQPHTYKHMNTHMHTHVHTHRALIPKNST